MPWFQARLGIHFKFFTWQCGKGWLHQQPEMTFHMHMLDPLSLLQKFDLHPAKNTGCHSYLSAEFQMNSKGCFMQYILLSRSVTLLRSRSDTRNYNFLALHKKKNNSVFMGNSFLVLIRRDVSTTPCWRLCVAHPVMLQGNWFNETASCLHLIHVSNRVNS